MISMRCMCVVLLCSIGFMGCSGMKQAVSEETSKPGTPASDSSLVVKGRGLCQSMGCLSCHSLDGTSSQGPTFKGMYSAEQTVPVEGFPACIMPANFTEEEAIAVIGFIKSTR